MIESGPNASSRIAVITGAAGGIGAALVKAFTACGHRVIALDNAPPPASLVCWRYLQTDLQRLVSDPACAVETLSAIESLAGDGGLSVLVNNAAIQVLGGVNAIEPASISTDMLKTGFAGEPERYAQLEGCHPQRRIGSPEEVAALAVSIAGGTLRYLHGACIGMDGGISGRLFDPA